MSIVKIYDLRHYERQKATEDQNAAVQNIIKKEQNPTLYGMISSYIIASILKFAGVKFQKSFTSPQPRAWKLANIILKTLDLNFEVKTDNRLDDIGSDPNAKDLVKIGKKLEKEWGMSIEHVFLTQLGEIRSYVFGRASEQVEAMLEYAAECTENTNILCCRHGIAVEAVGSLLKAKIAKDSISAEDIVVGSVGGPLATCEGLIYTFTVENAVAKIISVSEFRLPDEVKHLEKIFTNK